MRVLTDVIKRMCGKYFILFCIEFINTVFFVVLLHLKLAFCLSVVNDSTSYDGTH